MARRKTKAAYLQEKFGKGVLVDSVPFKNFVVASIFINILLIILVLFAQTWLPPEIPLFYGKPQGKEQLTSSLVLVLPSIASLFILITNISLGAAVKDIFLRKTLVLAGVAATFFSAITTVKIIFLLGSF